MNRASSLLCRSVVYGAFLLASLDSALADDQVVLAGLGQGVKVYLDSHSIPHIYAKSWPDAARVLGYLHAGERLWQMDLFRRQGSGTVAEILGKDALESDIIVRQLGIRRGCEAVWNAGDIPA